MFNNNTIQWKFASNFNFLIVDKIDLNFYYKKMTEKNIWQFAAEILK